MSRKASLIVLLTGGVLIMTALAPAKPDLDNPTPYLIIGPNRVAIEIADDEPERTRGLSRRASLPAGTGLLFVFDAPGQYGFWMKDMRFPIDLIWIDENWRVVDVTARATPDSYPQVFYPDRPIKYVLEVNAGELILEKK